jgi:hypothetical protein
MVERHNSTGVECNTQVFCPTGNLTFPSLPVVVIVDPFSLQVVDNVLLELKE